MSLSLVNKDEVIYLTSYWFLLSSSLNSKQATISKWRITKAKIDFASTFWSRKLIVGHLFVLSYPSLVDSQVIFIPYSFSLEDNVLKRTKNNANSELYLNSNSTSEKKIRKGNISCVWILTKDFLKNLPRKARTTINM